MMDEPQQGSSEQSLAERKTRDRALILPLVGLLLLIPPVATIFQLDLRIAGVPFTALYLLVIWALLITIAALLSLRLRDSEVMKQDTAPDE